MKKTLFWALAFSLSAPVFAKQNSNTCTINHNGNQVTVTCTCTVSEACDEARKTLREMQEQ